MKKVLNFVLIYLSFYLSKALKRPLDWGMPIKIGFEPTTFCNLRCPECPSGLRNFTRPTGTSDLTLFERVITELHPHLVYLLLYFQGEPYLNPHFLKMARIASQHGIYAATSTNGHYLSPEKARETVESGLSEVIVSVDGATQVTYEAYRVGGNLEKVKEGIRNLVHARAEARTMHPFIILQFLVVRPNEHEIEAIQEMGKALGVDQVLFKTAQIYDFENGHPLIP
ncbi:MAG: radical SAM protein, partial [Bacteroidota bacterium]